MSAHISEEELTAEPGEKILTRIRVSASFLNRLRTNGDGPPFIKIGQSRNSKVLYLREDLDSWLANNKVDSTAELSWKATR